MVCSTKDGELFPPLFLMLFSWYCVLNLPHSRLGLSLSLFFFNLFGLHWVLAAAQRIFIASWGIFERGTQTLVGAHRLQSAWASVVVVKRLGFSMARGTFVPQQGTGPASRTLPGGCLTTGPPGKSPACLLLGPNLIRLSPWPVWNSSWAFLFPCLLEPPHWIVASVTQGHWNSHGRTKTLVEFLIFCY